MNVFSWTFQKRKAEEEKRRKAEAARRQLELEFEQMEIENKISNSGLEERSSVSPAKKTSSHFDKRKFGPKTIPETILLWIRKVMKVQNIYRSLFSYSKNEVWDHATSNFNL